MSEQTLPIGGEELRPQARKHDLVVRELPEEELVYDLKTHQAYCLNKTAAAIWKECNGERAVTEIAQTVAQELQAGIDEEVVWVAIRQLSRASLLENEIVLPAEAARFSRRQALRKIGLTGFALPLITTIIVPRAAQAQTCGPANNNVSQNADGCPCSGFDDCANNCCGFSAAVGNICVTPGTVLSGAPCRANCECASGSCPAAPSPRKCT